MIGAARSTKAASLLGMCAAGVGTSSDGVPIVVPAGSKCRSNTRITSCAQRTCSMSLLVSRLDKVKVRPSIVGSAAVDGGAEADVVEEEDVMDDEDGRGIWDMGGDAICSGIIGLGNDRRGIGSAGAEAETGN
jgi:hypothetical protein